MSFCMTLHDLHSGRRDDIHFRVTIHFAMLTTTVNIADGANGICDITRYLLFIVGDTICCSSCSCHITSARACVVSDNRSPFTDIFFNVIGSDIGNVIITTAIRFTIFIPVTGKKNSRGAMFSAFNHIDVYLRIGSRFFNEATTIYVINTCCRLNIHGDGTRVVGVDYKCISRLVCTRIFSLIATTNKVLNDDRLRTGIGLFDVNDNVTANTATLVITTIDVLEVTRCYRQVHIARNMSLI